MVQVKAFLTVNAVVALSLVHHAIAFAPSLAVPPPTRNAKSMSLKLLSDAHHHHHVALAGSIWPVIEKLQIGPTKAKAIVTNVNAICNWKGFTLLSFLAFGLTPLAKFAYHYRSKQLDSETDSESEQGADGLTTPANTKLRRQPHEMKRFGVVAFIDQISKVAVSVYVMDILSISFTTMGFRFPKMWKISEIYAKFAYTVWVVQRVLVYKKIALCRYFRVEPDDMGRAEIVNRLLNGIIVTISTLVFLDWMSIETNKAMTGLFAFGSAGTLAFTLASQGLVTQLLSGLFLMFSDKMYVGDSVVFGDGTSGKVMKLGWMETQLRDSNNVVTRVPNTLLSSQKVSNLSRVRQSQVKQTLRFQYGDAKVMPQLLEDIKAEIRAACPKLVTDGSRPFRVFWTDYNEDNLEVMIDTHFNIPPSSDAYWINRQNVLMAITRAIAKYNVELVPGKRELVLVPRTIPLPSASGNVGVEEADMVTIPNNDVTE